MLEYINTHLWLLPTLLALAFLAGVIAAATFRQFTIQALKKDLLHQRELQQRQIAQLNKSQQQLTDSFASLSRQALKENRESFLSLATQNIQQHQLSAKAEMDKREQSIQTLLTPMREALKRTENQLSSLEKERIKSHSALREQLQSMTLQQAKLQAETNNLVNALSRPQVRGQWGESTLRRLAELSGMVEYCDFIEQDTVRDSASARVLRPDMIVRMPDNRELIIDAKAPLDAYLKALAGTTKDERKMYLQQHARAVAGHIRTLSQKKYWDQFKDSPDYVVLFLPGEQFLSAALEADSQLLEYALSKQVILSSPTTLIALLRAVAFGWRQQAVAKNAEKIQQLGEDLYHRISIFSEHMSKVGNSLDKSVDHFNSAVGSLERNVLSGAHKFAELGIEQRKMLDNPKQIANKSRELQNQPADNQQKR